MDAVARLEAIEEIKQLKGRYFRGVDTKDWELFGSVFAEDAVLDNRASLRGDSGSDEGALFKGRAAIVDYVSTATSGATTAHLGTTPEIIVHSADTAEGIWKMHDVVSFPSDEGSRHPRLAGVRRLTGYGFYHEDYRKVAGEWKIARCRLTRLLVDIERSDVPEPALGAG